MPILIILLAWLSNPAFAEIDNPLTLGRAFELAKTFDLSIAKQQTDINKAFVKLKQLSPYFLTQHIDLRLARRESYRENLNDNWGYLVFNKRLYDENSDIALFAQKQHIKIQQLMLKHLWLVHKITVMRAFLEVVSADLEYQLSLEQLALSAVHRNRIKENYDIERASELDYLGSLSEVQFDVNRRIDVEAKQVSTRVVLAELLNLPFPERPDELIRPDFSKYLNRELGQLQTWHASITRYNLPLIMLKQSLNILKEKKQRYQNSLQLSIDAYLNLGEQSYQRDKNGRYKFGVTAKIPLFDQYKRHTIEQLDLDIKAKELEIESYQRTLNQTIVRLYLRLNTLKQKIRALAKQQEYYDYFLERARTEYEMRLSRDLGIAQVQWTENDWHTAQAEFQFVLTWQHLNLLAGGNIP